MLITVSSTTVDRAGAPVSMHRTVQASGSITDAALAAIRSRKDRGRAFVGDGVTITTPTGTLRFVLEEDENGLVLEPLEVR
jgi:hypothetical protein